MNRIEMRIISLFLTLASLTYNCQADSFKNITNFGNNPTNIGMYLYVPDKLQTSPPILVGLHWCHGSASQFYSGTQYAALADRYGYILICPDAKSNDSCWDVHSQEVLTHSGNGDAGGIVSMVKYVIKNYNADSTRVYVTGVSSGAMMTNVLIGSYPDVFKAGSVFAGVPFAGFAGNNSWNSNCASGRIIKTAQQWGDLVRAAYPGFSGKRPRVQLWHGTGDNVLNFINFGEEIKQWTNVLGVSQTPTSTEQNIPRNTWVRTRYMDKSGIVQVEAIKEQGQPHNLQVLYNEAIFFFGLDLPTMLNSIQPVVSEKVKFVLQNNAVRIENCENFSLFVKFFDIKGRLIYSNEFSGTHIVPFSGKSSTGCYLLTLESNNRVLVRKKFIATSL